MTGSDRREFLQRAAGAAAAFALPVPASAWHRRPTGAPLKLGVVGVGRQGRAILGELQKMEQAEVVALCDVVDSRLRAGLRRVRGARAFATHQELLEKGGVDAVIVATPTHRHAAVALDALAAGAHVYCEAPLAADIEDARAMARAARGAGVVFQTGMLARSDPIYSLARSFFLSGALQHLLSLRAQSSEKTSWRFPAADPADEKALNWRLDPDVTLGLAGEWGTHQFDVVHYFRDRYPVAVRGSGGVFCYDDGRSVADTVHCDLAFDDGVHLQWQGTLGNSYGGRYELFTGSNAAIKLAWTAGWMFKEADAPTQGWEVYANRETFHNDQGITLIADATKLARQGKLEEGVGLPNPPLYYGLQDFLTSVQDGQPPVCTVEEGLRAAVVGILAHRAVATGEEQEIDHELFEVD